MKAYKLLSLIFVLSSCSSLNVNALDEETLYEKKVESDIYDVECSGFSRLCNEKCSNNFEMGSYERGDYLEYKFKGDFFQIYGYKGEYGGQVRLVLDGKTSYTNTYIEGMNRYKSLIYEFKDLEYKEHTLKIINNENNWCSIDYFKTKMKESDYIRQSNLALIGDICCSNMYPKGGGNKDLNVIRNERIYKEGSSGYGPSQYDSFDGSGINENVFYMGYTFNSTYPVSKVVYQAGDYWGTGGWFKNGSLHLEALVNGNWIDVTLLEDVGYPVGDERGLFTSCKIYYFKFNTINCDGIRIIGDAGGSEHFVSVSQIEVYSDINTVSLAEGANYRSAKLI